MARPKRTLPERILPATTPSADGLAETPRELEKQAAHYFRSARAPNTVKAYASNLSDFATWCEVDAGGLSPMPAAPRTVALYIADVAGRGMKATTIQRRLAAIAQLHQEADSEDQTKTKAVRNTYRGIVREIGSFQEGKAPLLPPPSAVYFRPSRPSAGPRRRATGRSCSSGWPVDTG
jgi:hypothetical protein